MTTVRFTRKDGMLTGVTCTGHTGYAEAGEDIVCAAVSSVVQTAVLGLMQLVGVDVDYKVDEEEGFLSAELPRSSRRRSAMMRISSCGRHIWDCPISMKSSRTSSNWR